MIVTHKSDLPQGTLDLLILNVVALGPLHGYAIAQRLRQISREVVQRARRARFIRRCTGSRTAASSPRTGSCQTPAATPSSTS